LHSFAGVGLAIGTKDVLAQKAMANKKAFLRWQTTRVLIIDESKFLNVLNL
jgi:hypothetical protein